MASSTAVGRIPVCKILPTLFVFLKQARHTRTANKMSVGVKFACSLDVAIGNLDRFDSVVSRSTEYHAILYANCP